MQRIVNPYVNDTIKSVLILHGLFTNDKIWLINGIGEIYPNGSYIENDGKDIANCSAILHGSTSVRALPFLLSACGYDVWLGNHRGTSYSRGHIHLNTKCK